MIKEIDYTKLKHFCDPQELNFDATKDVEDFSQLIGQERAARALEFGLNVKKKGYNIYVSGIPGTGKTTFAGRYAESRAAEESIPEDLCYVYNFQNPKNPRLLTLKPGQGKSLQEDMEELISKLCAELPKAFNLKDFEESKASILKEFQDKRDSIIKEMTDEVKEQNFGVKTTNTGIYFMPIVDGEIISEEQFDELSQEQKDSISANSESIQKQATDIMRIIKEHEKDARKEVDKLEYSVGLFTVGYQMGPLLDKYNGNEKVMKYLLDVKEDILENIEDFIENEPDEEPLQALLPWYTKKSTEELFSKYKVNVLRDNSTLQTAPVIVDICPTYSSLVGEVEYDNEFGNLTTDFMKIKPGLLHKANGGYLILKAYDVFSNGQVWETLRRSLLTGEIMIEPFREHNTGVVLSGMKPEPVKLDVKIIMVGDGIYYDILYNYDDEFQKLFKVVVEFDYEMHANKNTVMETARFIKKFSQIEKTGDFDCSAVAKVIEFSSRLAESQNKLTTRFNKISEILTEADTWAKIDKQAVITDKYVQKAITEWEYRLGMYEEKLSGLIEDNIIMIDVHGEKIGQINGLAVLQVGDYAFAKPSKITATTYVGKAGIINIEKEAEMSGNIHEKGIQVLIGYLGQTYAQEFPLSLSCRICFEQNYSGIDGDSASSTELYAVLSSLSGLPINQEIAVTGSINQRGEIQPIGGVTYKIEGFYELCEKRGLTGKQGVIIPAQNVKDLVLKDKVIEAVKDGMFHIYAINHVNEGIELLTGVEVGEKNEKGKYPAGSVHGKVIKKLKDFYKRSLNE